MVNFDKILNVFPEIFPRDPDSTLYKYTDAHQDEVEDFEQKLEEVQNSHFIDKAEDEDLDRIGAMFGPLGERAGRTDQEYRIYLKTIVQAYRGAGTVPAIKKAVAAGLGVDEEDVIIEETYSDLKYHIKLKDWSDHDGSTVEALADLADASVVTFDRTHYIIEDEEELLSDSVTIRPGLALDEPTTLDDPVGVNPDKTSIEELTTLDDPVGVDPDKTSTEEPTALDDGVDVDPDKTNVTEVTQADDPVEVDENVSGKARWDDENSSEAEWGFFEWAVLEELTRAAADAAVTEDGMSVDPNLTVVAETATITDSTNVDPYLTTTEEPATTTDEVKVNADKTTAGDSVFVADSVNVDDDTTTVDDGLHSNDNVGVDQRTTGVSDGISVSESVYTATTTVAWDSGDWGAINWAREHN